MGGRIAAVNISTKKGRTKAPITRVNLIKGFGLEGDAHGGGGERQVSLLAKESVDKMKASDLKGFCTEKFVQNITTEGIMLHILHKGTRLSMGEAVLEISHVGKDCYEGCHILKQSRKCVLATEGVFARVIKGGIIKPGDNIEILRQ